MITLISLLLNRRQKTSWESKKRKKIVLIEITSVHWNCILIMKRDYRTDTSDYGATEWASKQLLYPSGNFHWIITGGTNSFYWVADVRVDRGRFGIGGFETLFWLQLVSEGKRFSSATVNQKSSFQKPFWLSQLKLAGPPNSQRGTFLNRIYNSYRRLMDTWTICTREMASNLIEHSIQCSSLPCSRYNRAMAVMAMICVRY